MNPLENVFSHDVVHFLSRYFLNESEVLYFNGKYQKIRYFLTFLCQVGDLDLLMKIKPEIDEQLVNLACSAGDINILEWIHHKKANLNNVEAFCCAVESKQFHVLHWLLEHGYHLNGAPFISAAKSGNIYILKWLKEHNCPWDYRSFSHATTHGRIDLMEWFKEHNCPMDEFVFERAVKSGNLNILKWLKENNCPWNSRTFEVAIWFGDLDILEWLKANNCPFIQSNVCNIISGIFFQKNYLLVLQWLFENQYLSDKSVFRYIFFSSIELLKWIHQNHFEMSH